MIARLKYLLCLVALALGSVSSAIAVDAAHTVRARDTLFNPGHTNYVQIELTSGGDENALGFTFTYDPTVLTFIEAKLASGGAGSTLNVNPVFASLGRIGIALGKGASEKFTPGSIVLVELGFTAIPGKEGTSHTIGFSDHIIGREIADIFANTIPGLFVSGIARVNSLPTISTIGDIVTAEDVNASINFTINDIETPIANLSVSVTSSNPSLFPAANLTLGGSDGNRSLTLKPAANLFGSGSITLSVSDGFLTAQRTFNAVVTAVNDAPTAVSDSFTVAEDGALSIPVSSLIGNDSPGPADEATQSLSLISVTGSSLMGGSVTISNTFVIYRPAANVTGPDVFVYTVRDSGFSGVDPRSSTGNVNIQITAVNDAPVLAAISNKTVNEEATLDFTITATDVENQTLTYTLVSGAPTGAAISPTGRLTWTPAESQGSGVYEITVSVTDTSGAAVARTFQVTVLEVNKAPSVAVIPDQTISEGQALELTVSAIDTDLPAQGVSLSLSGAPAGMTMNGAGVITWTPTEAQGGASYPISVIATDDATPALSVSQTFTVTVTEVNQTPTFTVSNQSVAEGSLLSFNVSVVDLDLPANALSFALSNAPAGMAISSSGLVTWTPTEAQGPGSYTVGITVTDDGIPAAVGFGVFTVTVSELNTAPAIPSIAAKSVNELSTLSFNVGAVDADLPAGTLAYTLQNAPAGMTINSSGLVTWTPTEEQGPGVFNVTVQAVDNAATPLSASATFAVTVNEINRAPVLSVANRTANEGELLTFNLIGTDLDIPANALSFSLQNAPTGMTVTSAGQVSWIPSEAQGPGVYVITAVVQDNGVPSLSDSVNFTLTINEANNPPSLALIDQTVAENSPLTFNVNATDSDVPANQLNYALQNAPAGMMINGSGQITWTPTEAQGPGEYSVSVLVNDTISPGVVISGTVRISVTEVNAAPVVAVENKTIAEGSLLSFNAGATDSDLPANVITYSLQNAPLGMTINAAGLVTWTPTEAQGPGVYTVTITAVDNAASPASASATFTVTVTEQNSAPIVTVANQTVNEGSLLDFTAGVVDADLPANTIGFALQNAPAGMVVSATGRITWTPTESQGPGVYAVTLTATDNGAGALTGAATFTVTVAEVNNAPVVSVTNRTVNEGTLLSFSAGATDSDIPANTLNYSLQNAPAGMSVNSAGLVTWTPTEAQGPGAYNVTLVVADNGFPIRTQSATFTVTVNEVNTAPIVAVANQTTAEEAELRFNITATDSDIPANTLTISLENQPTGMTVTPTGEVVWTPTELQGPGTYTVTAVVSDGSSPALVDFVDFTVTVTEANKAPVFTVNDVTIERDETVDFNVNATDLDIPANALTYSLQGAPAGMTISSSGRIQYTAPISQGAGDFSVSVTVTDNGTPARSTTKQFILTLLNSNNHAPAITLGNASINEGTVLRLTPIVTDDDGPTEFSFALQNAPSGMVVSASGEITWTPSEAQGPGIHTAQLLVSDNGTPELTSVASFTVTVNEVNDAPIVTASNTTVAEGSLLSIPLAAHDPDLPPNSVTRSIANAPAGMTLTAAGQINWIPTEGQGPAVYTISAIAVDNGSPSRATTNTLTITVTEVNEAPTVVAADQTVSEGSLLNFTVQAADADIPANALQYALQNAPSGMTINSNGQISWIPTETQGGNHTATVVVTDNGSPVRTSSTTFDIRVDESNVAPTISAFSPVALQERELLTLQTVASDSDVPSQTLSYSISGGPEGLSIDPQTGQITWIPGGTDGGAHTVTVTVSDNGSPSLSAIATLQIAVSVINDAPVIQLPSDEHIAAGGVPRKLSPIVVTDDSGSSPIRVTLSSTNGLLSLGVSNGLTFVGTPTPKRIVFDATLANANAALADVTFTSDGSFVGLDYVVVNVNDLGATGTGGAQQASASLAIEVASVNTPPGIVVPAVQTTPEFTLKRITVTVSDADGDLGSLELSVTSSNPTLIPTSAITITGAGAERTVNVTPAVGRIGEAELTITVRDPAGATAEGKVKVTVVAVPPLITVHPAPTMTLQEGATLELAAAATGTPPLSYQWRFNGEIIPGATTNILILPNLVGTNTGKYQLEIANQAGRRFTTETELTVLIGPKISAQPVGARRGVGQSHTFAVAADGAHPISYQWVRNGSPIVGATNDTLSLTNLNEGNGGEYYVDIWNDVGLVSSAKALLEIEIAPRIIAQPTSITVNEGNAASLTVVAEGAQPITYQWFKNGLPIASGRNSTLTFSAAGPNDSGEYRVALTNSVGNAVSATVTVAVVEKVRFTSSPLSQQRNQGESTSFFVQATGAAPLSYQWFRNGAPVTGATSATLSLPNVTSAVEGSYFVRVSNLISTNQTPPANLIVIVPPAITEPLTNRSVAVGTPVHFTAVVSGTEPLRFQWTHAGTNIPGATTATLDLGAVDSSDAGLYALTVENNAGAASASATLTVHVPISITTQPASATVLQGQNTTLSVAVTGSGPVSYQWLFNGSVIPNGTNATYTITNAQIGNDGRYQVRIENPAGSVNSAVAVVTVIVPPTIIRQPISQEVALGADALLEVVISGSPSTYQWFKNGDIIPGATSASLVLEDISATSVGNYHVVVNNLAGQATSLPARIAVIAPPTITFPPFDIAIRAGVDYPIILGVEGSAPFSYEWRFNGQPIPGATNAVFTIVNPQDTELRVDSGVYSVLVTNIAGAELSAPATIRVINPVVIDIAPQGGVFRLGEPFTLSVLASGTSPFTYQWRRNGQNLTGETGPTLRIATATDAATGDYDVIVANELTSATSAIASVVVAGPPRVQSLPLQSFVNVGATHVLSAVAEGAPPFTFQWLINGVPIPGANAATYTIANSHPTNSGSYQVVVSNPGGAVSSNPSAVLVNAPEVVLTDSITIAPTTNGIAGFFRSDNFNATADVGEEHIPGKAARKSVWFSWQAPELGIVTFTTLGSTFDTTMAAYRGTRGPTGTMQRVASDEDGGAYLSSAISFTAEAGETYHVAIDGYQGSSGHILVNWNFASSTIRLPQILAAPGSYVALTNSTYEFSVQAASPDGHQLAYQWFLGTQPIAGATTSRLLLQNLQGINAGIYRVAVTNGVETGRTDLPATVLSAALEITTDTNLVGSIPAIEDKLTFTNSAAGPLAIGSQKLHRLATVTRGYSGAQVFSTRGAFRDPGEPVHCGIQGGASTWWLYTAPDTGMMRISTEGSDYDTVLAVYSGDADFGSLVSVACDNDSGPNGTSVVTFQAQANTTYFVVVDGVAGVSGLARLTYDLAGAPQIVEQPAALNNTGGLQALADAPIVQAVPAGGNLTLRVVARSSIGSTPVNYQWRLNGGNIRGATGNSYTISNIDVRRAGDYHVVVSNFAGSVESRVVRVTVAVPLAIQTPPANVGVAVGAAASFSVSATGTGPFTYQWQFNNQNIARANGSTYVLNNVQAANAGSYRVIVSNGAESVSATATLTLLTPPAITQQPIGQTIVEGQPITLGVSATGSAPLTYQWRFKGVAIANATAPTFTIPQVRAGDSGDYSVVVSNTVRSVVSDSVVLNVQSPVAIVTAPQSGSVAVGQTLTLNVEARGTAPIAYQWFFNGTALNGQTSAQLVLGNMQPAQGGDYTVAVSNPVNLVTSAAARISVVSAPVITTQPLSRTNAVGSSTTFTVTAVGSGTLRYQWRYNGADIPGATSASFTIPTVSASAGGNYRVSVANDAGAILSDAATLTVLSPPVINQQPEGRTTVPGGSIVFTVSASGGSPLRYQWFFNGSALTGQTSPTLSLANVQNGNVGQYRVRVENGVGSVESAAVGLTILASPVITQQPANATLAAGAPLSLSVGASGSGTLNYQWRRNGQNITGANSAIFNIASATAQDSGLYSVLVSNDAGATNSATATVTIGAAPVIALQPQNRQVTPGSSATFTVVATGAAPLSYQWSRNGTPISGATSATLSLNNIGASNVGTYTVQVSNTAGSVVSQGAALTLQTGAALQTTAATFLANGAFRLSIAGPATGNFQLLASEDLSNWTLLTTFTFVNGRFEYDDLDADLRDGRYYRIVQVP